MPNLLFLMERLTRFERVTTTFGGLYSFQTELQAQKILYSNIYRLGQTKVEFKLYSPLSIRMSSPEQDLLITVRK